MTPALLDQRPARRPELVIGPGLLRGPAPVHVVKDGRTGSRCEVGPKEHFVLTRLDGEHTLAEVGAAYAQHFGRRLADANWLQLLSLLGSRDLLVTEPEPRRDPAPATAKRRRIIGPLRGDIVLFNPSAPLHVLHRRLRPLLTARVALPLLLVLCAAQVVLFAHLPELMAGYHLLYRQPELIPVVTGLLYVSMLLHELGHGLATVHFGGEATEVGLRWNLPTAGLYCSVDDVLLFRSRWQRVATAAAGPAVDLAFQAPFLVLWLRLPAGDPTKSGVGALLLLVTSRIVYNLLPLPTLDGSLMLGYALNVSRPSAESRRYLGLLIRRDAEVRRYPRRAAAAYLGYAATVTAFGLASAAVVAERIGGWRPTTLDRVSFGVLALMIVARILGPRLHARRTRREAARARDGRDAAAVPLPEAAPTPPDLRPEPKEARMRPIQSAASPAVVVEKISKAYGQVQACREVSLTVERGELFGVLGPNGAGKTTLLEIMEGLRRPDSGLVSVLGAEPWRRDPDLLLRIGVQTQASAFFIRLTAREHLETVTALYGLGRAAAHAAIERFGLAGSADTQIAKLSGGQRQRLAVAAALAHDPDLVFLDEPTAALDPQARRDLWQLLREIRGQGKTIVYTTHHLDEAEALCDRVAIMSGGSVAAVGEPQELIGSLHQPVRLLVPGGRITVGAARGLAGVDGAVAEGSCVVIATHQPGLVYSAVAEIAGPQGIRTQTATLEDVYLTLTGTEYTS